MLTNDDRDIVGVLNVIIAGMRDLPPMPDDTVIDYWEQKQEKKWYEILKDKEEENK